MNIMVPYGFLIIEEMAKIVKREPNFGDEHHVDALRALACIIAKAHLKRSRSKQHGLYNEPSRQKGVNEQNA